MESLVGKFMNTGYGTDVTPNEIIEQINEKTIAIRQMATVFNKEKSNLDFAVGGFCAHASGRQVWDITSNPSYPLIIFTKRKDGKWYMKGYPMERGMGRTISDKPIKYYDYNF